MTPPKNHLRKKKLFLEAEVVDYIPNDDISCQKITRIGNSNYVVLPNQWSMFFDDDADVTKVLLKIKIPMEGLAGAIAHIEYDCMLVVESDDFPLLKLVKK